LQQIQIRLHEIDDCQLAIGWGDQTSQGFSRQSWCWNHSSASTDAVCRPARLNPSTGRATTVDITGRYTEAEVWYSTAVEPLASRRAERVQASHVYWWRLPDFT